MQIPEYMEYRKINKVIFLTKHGLVLNRRLVKDLIGLSRNKEYIMVYKGCIITDIFTAHMQNGNLESLVQAMTEIVKMTSKIKYEIPRARAIVCSREELQPFIYLCDLYQSRYTLYRKIYRKVEIYNLECFKYYKSILEGFYKTEDELDLWLKNDDQVPSSFKRVLNGHVKFLGKNLVDMSMF